MQVPFGWLDLGEGEVEEAVRRLVLGLALGLRPEETTVVKKRERWNCLSFLPAHLAVVQAFGALAAKQLRDAGEWTLVQARPAPCCALRWHARRAVYDRALREWAGRNDAVVSSSSELLRSCRLRLWRAEDGSAEASLADLPHRWSVVIDPVVHEDGAALLSPMGMRYAGRLRVGSKVVLRVPILGAHPGDVGIVYEVYDRSNADDGESTGFGLILSNMNYDGFSPDDVSWMLDLTDEVSERHRYYRFQHVGNLTRDFPDPADFTLLPPVPPGFGAPSVGRQRYAW